MTDMILNSESPISLREFVKDNEVKVCRFLQFMLIGFAGLEEVTLEVFRNFGRAFQKQELKKNSEWEKAGLRIELFAMAWQAVIRAQGRVDYTWSFGRDTRPLKQLDIDLLSEGAIQRPTRRDSEMYLSRLARVDIDFRAPIVLRDILLLDDEEVIRILGIRWGVYRHRLHRGRLAFRESLKGKQSREV